MPLSLKRDNTLQNICETTRFETQQFVSKSSYSSVILKGLRGMPHVSPSGIFIVISMNVYEENTHHQNYLIFQLEYEALLIYHPKVK